jgi:hypothetical protein
LNKLTLSASFGPLPLFCRLHRVEGGILEPADHRRSTQHVVERAQVVVDDRLARQPKDSAEAAQDDRFAAFVDRAGLDFAVFLIGEQGREVADAQQLRRLEVGQVALASDRAIGRRAGHRPSAAPCSRPPRAATGSRWSCSRRAG